jgi:hypothetical protein
LHRPIAREKGGEQQTEDGDPTGFRQDQTELTRTDTPASIHGRHISSLQPVTPTAVRFSPLA